MIHRWRNGDDEDGARRSQRDEGRGGEEGDSEDGDGDGDGGGEQEAWVRGEDEGFSSTISGTRVRVNKAAGPDCWP